MLFYGVFAAVIAGVLAAQPRLPLLVSWLPAAGLIGLWLAHRNDDKDQARLLDFLTVLAVVAAIIGIAFGIMVRRERIDRS